MKHAYWWQVPRLLRDSIDPDTNQLWVLPTAVTIIGAGVTDELTKVTKKEYKNLHERDPPPPGCDGLTLNYDQLHADGTPVRRELIHNVLQVATVLGLSQRTLSDWHSRTGLCVKWTLVHGSMTAGMRAGRIPEFLLRVQKDGVGLLNPEVWVGSPQIENARDLLNAWFWISAESHMIGTVKDYEMSALVARTTLPLVLCSYEIMLALINNSALTISMDAYRSVF